MDELKIKSLYLDLSRTLATPLLEKHEYAWEILDFLGEFIREIGKNLPKEEYNCIGWSFKKSGS